MIGRACHLGATMVAAIRAATSETPVNSRLVEIRQLKRAIANPSGKPPNPTRTTVIAVAVFGAVLNGSVKPTGSLNVFDRGCCILLRCNADRVPERRPCHHANDHRPKIHIHACLRTALAFTAVPMGRTRRRADQRRA